MAGVWISPKTETSSYQLDELWHFVSRRPRTETHENIYVMTMISENPRQIVGFMASHTKTAVEIQEIVDSAPAVDKYFTDGNYTYCDVLYPVEHIRNSWDKSDTHDVESINSDLRTYLAGLRRRSRCFYRKLETLNAVLALLVNAYNKFGEYKQRYRQPVVHRTDPTGRHLHKFRDLGLGIMDFV